MSIEVLPRLGADWRPVDCEHREYFFELALRYRSWGWSVFPLFRKTPTTRVPTEREREDAELYHKPFPRRRQGWKRHQGGQCSERVLEGEFDRATAIDGLGVVATAIAVIDFDDGQAYREWADANPELAELFPTVRTGRGYHLYHRPTESKWFKFSGGEYIGDNAHYFVGAGSYHPTGVSYDWVGAPPESSEDFPRAHWTDFHLPRPRLATSPTPRPVRQPRDYPPSPPREISEWRAVALCLPNGPGERNSKLWELARRCKFSPGADPKNWFASWWESAQDIVGTPEKSVSRRDFERLFKLAQRPIGEGFREKMAERLAPFANPDEKLRELCRALQEYSSPNPFFLSIRLASELTGFTPRTVARKLKGLSGLTLSKAGTLYSAAEYSYCPPPEPPSPSTSCVPLSETQELLTLIRSDGGTWDAGVRALASRIGLSLAKTHRLLKRAVESGEIMYSKGVGKRTSVYKIK